MTIWELIAKFIEAILNAFKTVKLTISVSGSGTTSPSAGVHDYRRNVSIAVSAKPAAGWRFDHWEGDLTGSKNPDVVKMSVNKTIVAVFVREQYQVNAQANPVEGGYVSRDNPGPYYYGSSISLTAVANPGYRFVSWTGSVNSTVPTINLIVNGNINVTANFEQVQYTLTINIEGDGSGSVAKAPDKPTYNAGETVTLTATPAPGSKFSKWTIDGQDKTENPTNVTMG